jgi:hypothetical protein
MVGWPGHARWAHVDIFNLLGIDPHSTDLTWEIVNARPRQIAEKLLPNDPAIIPPDGLSIALVNSFRSELFNLLYPSVQRGEKLQAGDATPDSRRDLAQALDKINRAKLNGHTRTWDAEKGVPGDWLGVDAPLNHSDMPVGSSVAPLSNSFAAARTVCINRQHNSARLFCAGWPPSRCSSAAMLLEGFPRETSLRCR